MNKVHVMFERSYKEPLQRGWRVTFGSRATVCNMCVGKITNDAFYNKTVVPTAEQSAMITKENK